MALLSGSVLVCGSPNANAIEPQPAIVQSSLQPALFEQYGGAILLAALVVILQTGVIIALLLENRRRRRAERATRAHLSEAARMSRFGAAGELSSSIAHEIKQPLAAIAANASAALRWLGRPTPDLGEAKGALERIVNEAHRATDLIGAIRAIFKETGEDKVPIDINVLVRGILALLRTELEKRKILVVTDLSEGLPNIVGSPAALQQVVLNVIADVAKAMDPVEDRARELRIASAREAGGIVLVVEHSAGGDPQNVKQTLEPLFAMKSQRMEVGFSICRSIVEAHGGRVSASSDDPLGLSLRIWLPTNEAGGPS